jgi:hypothetical protein
VAWKYSNRPGLSLGASIRQSSLSLSVGHGDAGHVLTIIVSFLCLLSPTLRISSTQFLASPIRVN